MRPPQRVRVLRPFLHAGRVYGSGERATLDSALADELREAGYVAPIVNGEAVQRPSGPWCEPVTR